MSVHCGGGRGGGEASHSIPESYSPVYLLYCFVTGHTGGVVLKSSRHPPRSDPHHIHYITGDTSKHMSHQRPGHSGEQDRQLVCGHTVADKGHRQALGQGRYVGRVAHRHSG